MIKDQNKYQFYDYSESEIDFKFIEFLIKEGLVRL